MNTTDQPPVPETTPADPASSMPLFSRLLNIFADPGEVFERVKSGPGSAANWLAPAFISTVVGIISAIVIFSQPAITQKLHEQQVQEIDKRVQAGLMKQADADKALDVIEKIMGPTMLKVFGGVSAIVVSFLRVFWWAFVLWLLGMIFLKVKLNYLKLAEVVGLASMIVILGMVVGTLLSVALGKMSGASLALLIHDVDYKNKTHLMMGAANVFNLWFAGVLSVGLARLAGVPFMRAAVVFGGFWVVWNLALIFAGLGSFAQ